VEVGTTLSFLWGGKISPKLNQGNPKPISLGPQERALLKKESNPEGKKKFGSPK